MSNEWYDTFLDKASSGDNFDWIADTIIVMLVDGTYGPDTSASGNSFISNIPGTAIIQRSAGLTGKTDVGGILDANDIILSLVPAGHVCPYLIVARSTGVDATSDLMIKIDTAQNLPFTSTGGDAGVQWSALPNKIAKL